MIRKRGSSSDSTQLPKKFVIETAGVRLELVARHYLKVCEILHGTGVVVLDPRIILELYDSESISSDVRDMSGVVEELGRWLFRLQTYSKFVQETKNDILDLWDWCRHSYFLTQKIHEKPSILQTCYLLNSNLRHFRWQIPEDYFPTMNLTTPNQSYNAISKWWSFENTLDETVEMISFAKKGDNPVFVLGLFCGWVARNMYNAFGRDLNTLIPAISKALCTIAGEKDKDGFLLWNMPFTNLVDGIEDGWEESFLKSFSDLYKLELQFRQANKNILLYSQEPSNIQTLNHARERVDRTLVYFCLALDCDVPVLESLNAFLWQEHNLRMLSRAY